MVLKHRPWRTTEVEVGPEPVFVKRYHDARLPGRGLARWRDRRRARREASRLDELRRAGVPVPAVIDVREDEAGVELRLEYLAGTETLRERLDGAGGAPAHALARTLGALLGRLHAAGFAHGDLHAGNVLLGQGERAWIVDAAEITRASQSKCARDLVQAVAELREDTTVRFRARCWIEYVRTAPHVRRAEAASLAEAIEGAARIARRERVRVERDRWLRESGACALHVDGALRVLAPCATQRDAALGLARDAVQVASRGGTRDAVQATSSGAAPAEFRCVSRASRTAWTDAARLVEHRVPTVLPAVLVEAPSILACFELPRGARAPVPGSAEDARALGMLAGSLWDRGLALATCAVFLDAHGIAAVDAGAGLHAARSLRRCLLPWAAFGSISADFETAFLDAQRGSRVQRSMLQALFERAGRIA